jgi:hypothetical protein
MHLVQQTARSVCSTLNHHDSFEQFPGRNSPRNSAMFITREFYLLRRMNRRPYTSLLAREHYTGGASSDRLRT